VTAAVPATASPERAAAPTAVTAAPRPTADQAETSSLAYLVAAGLLAVSVVVSLRARRREFRLGEVYW
jgi:hypothetical protein